MDKNLPLAINGLSLQAATEKIIAAGYRFRIIEWENADGTKLHLDNPARRAYNDQKMVNLRVRCGQVVYYTLG